MLKIRLQRVGRRNHAQFRMVVTEHARAAKSSSYVEIVGNYDPHTNTINVDDERVKYWMEKGAQVSDTMHNLLVTKGIIKGKKINVLPKKTPIVKEEKSKEEETKEETPVEEAKEEAIEDTKEEKTEEKASAADEDAEKKDA